MKGKDHPIIIVRRKKAHAAHHGGAWKVAYADFVTAMMAFFLVMWLSAADSRVREAVAGYFRNPGVLPHEASTSLLAAGAGGLDAGRLPRLDDRETGRNDADQQSLATAAERIREKLERASQAASLRDQIELSVTNEGLRIELVDQAGSSFFDSGSDVLRGESVQLLQTIAGEIAALENDVVIEGHTDSRPYATGEKYGNWELSVDRANAARRVMRDAGLGPAQVRAVRGFADTQLRHAESPLDPRNRRVSIVVRTQAAATLEARVTGR